MVQYKQDMPPPGGYEPLQWARIPLNPGLPNLVRVALFVGVSAASFLVYKYSRFQKNLEKIEMRCARLAIYPLIKAEEDRLILKQFKKNREVEEELMKDVPGWEVGKWKNYPVFLSLKPDEFFMPSSYEYYAHADPKTIRKFRHIASFT